MEDVHISVVAGDYSAAELKRLARELNKVHPLVEARIEDVRHQSAFPDTVVLWTPWSSDNAPRRANECMRVAIGWARGRASRSGSSQRVLMMGHDGEVLDALEMSWPDRTLVQLVTEFTTPQDPRLTK